MLTECWCTSWALGHNDALMAAVGRAARAAWAAWAVWAGRLGHVYSNTFSYSTMPTFVSFFELSSFPQKTTMGLNIFLKVTLAWHILQYFTNSCFSIIGTTDYGHPMKALVIKFMSSEKATKIDKIFTVNLTVCTLKYEINEHACLFNSIILIYCWVYSKAKQLN